MDTESNDEQTRILSEAEKLDAKNAIGCGVPRRVVAASYSLTEDQLRKQIGDRKAPIPDPPALIGPDEIAQMRERKKQLRDLRKRFGGGNG